MKINEKDITIHPISGDDSKGLLYFYDGKLYRSPKKHYNFILEKAKKLPYVQETTLTNHTLRTAKDGNLPVYEHKHYPHRVRISELPPPHAKKIIEAFCRINMEAVKYSIICYELHEGNINYTIDGIKYIDMTGFRDLNSESIRHSFERVVAFSAKYLRNRRIKSLHNLDYTKPESWEKLLKKVSATEIRELEASGWFTGYSHNMDIYKPVNEKAAAVLETLKEVKDVKTITDIGSNKGYYTFMALLNVEGAESAIGFEYDESCVNFAIDINNNKFKLPAVFAKKSIQDVIADKTYEHDRYASDMIMALAIVHWLRKRQNDISSESFADMLTKYGKKYILIENTHKNNLVEYEKLITDRGYELVSRRQTYPEERRVSLYSKI